MSPQQRLHPESDFVRASLEELDDEMVIRHYEAQERHHINQRRQFMLRRIILTAVTLALSAGAVWFSLWLDARGVQ